MKGSILAVSLVLTAAAMQGCQAPDESEVPAARTGAIQTTRFEVAETDEPAPTPFRKTGDLYVLETGCDCILAITPAGKVTVAATKQQILDVTGAGRVSMSGSGVAFDATGTMFFPDGESGAVLKMERGGKLSVLVSGAQLQKATGLDDNDPEGLALDLAGTLYVTDNISDSVLRVDPATGEVSVVESGKDMGALLGIETVNLSSSLVVGTGGVIYTTNEDDPQAIIGIGPARGVGVVATSRLFEGLKGYMTVAKNGDLVVMDADAEVVFRVSTVGEVATYLSEPQLQAPIGGEDGRYRGGIAFDSDGNLYVLEAHENHILRFDSGFQGSIWVDRAAIQTATRSVPDLDGGIAFAPAPTP